MPANVGAAVLQDNFNIASDNYMQGAQLAMRRKQQQLQERSLQQEQAAANAKASHDAYLYGEKKLTDPKIIENVPAERQKQVVSKRDELFGKFQDAFARNPNMSIMDIDRQFGGELSDLSKLKADINNANENIKTVAATLKTVPGVSPERAEALLRTNVFNQDGKLNDYSVEGLTKLLDENAGEIVTDYTAADKYRKSLGVTSMGHTMKTVGPKGETKTGKYTSSLNPDMVLDDDGRPVIRGDKFVLNEPPKNEPISVGGVKLNRDEQTMAQVVLKGAREKNQLVFSTDEDHARIMSDPAMRFAVKANVQAAKHHYEEVNKEPFPKDPKMNELLEKTISHDLMSDAADAKSTEVVEQKAAQIHTTNNINMPGNGDQATRQYSGETSNVLKYKTSAGSSLVSGIGNESVSKYMMDHIGVKKDGKPYNANEVAVKETEPNKFVIFIPEQIPDGKKNADGTPHMVAGVKGETLAVIDGEEMNMALNKGNVSTSKGGQAQYKKVTGGGKAGKYSEADIKRAAQASGMSVADYKKAAGL